MRSLRAVAVCSLALVHLTPAHANGLDGLNAYVRELMAISRVPGVAVAVVNGDDVILKRGYGVRTAGERAPVDTDTVFAIGSMSKNFTATALGLLVDEGKLSWDEPLTRYVAGLRFSDPYLFANLTLRDALSHRTGLERADLAWFANSGKSRTDMLALIERVPLELPFRSGYLYNNFMYLAAGEAIPAVAGQSWDAFLKQKLFEPLGMQRTGTSARDLEGMGNVASPHYLMPERAVPTTYYNLDHMGPAGSINSSVSDMAHWCRLQLAEGRWHGKQLVAPEVLAQVRRPHTFLDLDRTGHAGTRHKAYALGIERMNYGDTLVAYSHGGAIQGMASTIAFVPEASVCVVVLTNGESSSGVREHVSSWVLDRLLGLDGGDYLASFRAALEKRRAQRTEIRRRHDEAHDGTARFELLASALAGTFSHDLYGALVLDAVGEEIRVSFGTASGATLVPHNTTSFDLQYPDPVRNAAVPVPMSLRVILGRDGQVESLLLDPPGDPGSGGIRFRRQATSR